MPAEIPLTAITLEITAAGPDLRPHDGVYTHSWTSMAADLATTNSLALHVRRHCRPIAFTARGQSEQRSCPQALSAQYRIPGGE